MKYINIFIFLIIVALFATNVTAQVVDTIAVKPTIAILNGTYILEWNSDADKKVGLGIQNPDTSKLLWSAGTIFGAVTQVQEDCKCILSEEDVNAITNFYNKYHSTDMSERIYNGWYMMRE